MIEDHMNSIFSVIDCYLNNGLTASNDILAFAESTLGIESIKELCHLLTTGDPDVDGLTDLLFSPDLELETSIAPFIPVEGLAPDETLSLTVKILNKHDTVMVTLGDTDVDVPVMLTEPLLDRFIGKLNLDKTSRAMNTGDQLSFFSEEDIISFRVLLRHSRYRANAERDSLIISLLEGLGRITGGTKPAIVHDCLSHLLELLSETPNNSDLSARLSMKMLNYKDMLEKAALFDDYLEKSTMEYLMSQKIQLPTFNVEEIRKKMYLTDLISSAIFGNPADPGREETIFYHESD